MMVVYTVGKLVIIFNEEMNSQSIYKNHEVSLSPYIRMRLFALQSPSTKESSSLQVRFVKNPLFTSGGLTI